MTTKEISAEQHSYENQSFLLDWMIDKATDTLSENSKPFNRTETVGDHKIFNVTQEKVDAMVSNIPTPKFKHNKNLIPMVLLLMYTINGIISNRPLVALCDSGISHCMFNKRALPFGATTFKTPSIN